MARKLRVEHPGAIYHVVNRVDLREAIFRDDGDRQHRLLGESRIGRDSAAGRRRLEEAMER
jgi:hypothetical protein